MGVVVDPTQMTFHVKAAAAAGLGIHDMIVVVDVDAGEFVGHVDDATKVMAACVVAAVVDEGVYDYTTEMKIVSED